MAGHVAAREEARPVLQVLQAAQPVLVTHGEVVVDHHLVPQYGAGQALLPGQQLIVEPDEVMSVFKLSMSLSVTFH